jgi:hypothetical protein
MLPGSLIDALGEFVNTATLKVCPGGPCGHAIRDESHFLEGCYNAASVVAEIRMPDSSTCKHLRTQVIAKDKDEQYVECLDCGAILEAGEIEEPPSGFDESLSDA